MSEMDNWVIEVNKKLESMKDSPTPLEYHWEKHSIYKLPASVTDLNKKAYGPQVVSFGPYHHGEEHLKRMEEHKQRALLQYLKRSGKPLQMFVESLKKEVQVLKDSYAQLDISWQKNSDGFLQLMILDGCFILEVIGIISPDKLSGYDSKDPIFSRHGQLYMMPHIRRDMLLLENQLPMLVLYKLAAVESGGAKGEEDVNKLILNYGFSKPAAAGLGKCSHVLDLYRKNLLHGEPEKPSSRRRKYKDVGDIIRSATELNEAGIEFRKSKTKSLKDISFHRGVLYLPVIVVDDNTEAVLLNLMAFERFHVDAGNEVTSYVFFMDNIIDNEKDVALLHSNGIIQNAIGSDKAVAKLFNSLSKDIVLDPDSSLDLVHKQVNAYCKKRWNEWRANLMHTYFSNPWALLSVIAALFLFALTIVSTVYGVLSYYQSQSPSPSPPMVVLAPPPLPAGPPPTSAPPMHPPKPSRRH